MEDEYKSDNDEGEAEDTVDDTQDDNADPSEPKKVF